MKEVYVLKRSYEGNCDVYLFDSYEKAKSDALYISCFEGYKLDEIDECYINDEDESITINPWDEVGSVVEVYKDEVK